MRKNKKNVDVSISITEFQFKYISDYLKFIKSRSILININKNIVEISFSYKGKIRTLTSVIIPKDRFFKYNDLIEISKLIRKNFTISQVFVPHFHSVIILYLSSVFKSSSPNSKISAYYEGAAAYHDSVLEQSKVYLVFASIINSIRFRKRMMLRNDIFYRPKFFFDKFISPEPDRVCHKCNTLVKHKLEYKLAYIKRDSVLVLGTYKNNDIKKSLDINKELLNTALEYGGKIFYKSHPNFSYTPEHSDVYLCEKNKSGEDLVGELQPSFIVSGPSSVLINVGSNIPKEVVITIIGTKSEIELFKSIIRNKERYVFKYVY